MRHHHMKTCSKCGTAKVLEDFHRRARSPDGRKPYCKTCHRDLFGRPSEMRRALQCSEIRLGQHLAGEVKGKRLVCWLEKRCKNCNVVRPLAAFRPHAGRHDSRSTVCVECLPRRVPMSPDQRREQKRARMQQIRRTAAGALNHRMSRGMWQALRRGKGARSWTSLVGYSVGDLQAHLERCFSPGMSWSNFGRWHIDHVRPLASFAFYRPEDPEFQEAWSLKNLQPLWALDNLRKGARWPAHAI